MPDDPTHPQLTHAEWPPATRHRATWHGHASKPVAASRLTTHARAENQKPGQIDDLPGLVFGRRDWTRTNDPHHVKVVL